MTETDIKMAAGLLDMREELRGYIDGAVGADTKDFAFAELHVTFNETHADGSVSDWTASYRVPKAVLVVALEGAIMEVQKRIDQLGVTP